MLHSLNPFFLQNIDTTQSSQLSNSLRSLCWSRRRLSSKPVRCPSSNTFDQFSRRFLSVKRRFMLELNNLRKEPASPSINANIISLNTGMRFFRVKVNLIFRLSNDWKTTWSILDDARRRFWGLFSISSGFGQLFSRSTRTWYQKFLGQSLRRDSLTCCGGKSTLNVFPWNYPLHFRWLNSKWIFQSFGILWTYYILMFSISVRKINIDS